MAKIQELREQRNAKAREMRKLLEDNPGDKWTSELNDKFDAMEREITALDAEVDRVQRVMDLAGEAHERENVEAAAAKLEHDKPQGTDGLFGKWLKGGKDALTAEERALIKNTMSTTTGSEGGYTVQTDVAKRVLDALKAFGGMRQVSTIITTDAGNPMNFPTSDGTAEEGEILDQNDPASDGDVDFGTKPLPVYKYSSKIVAVPIELLQDSSVDIEAFVRGRIVTRLGRITNKHFTTGTGSDQPTGLITAASVGKTGASGQTTSIGFDDLVDLVHSVDPAYRELGQCRWMFNDTTLKALRKLKDENLRPIWMPGDAEGITGGLPATLLGYAYTYNQHMASMAASAKSVAFGDFTFYTIRDVMAITFMRFDDSAYAKKGQVGFLAFMRSGGNFIDVGGAVKLYQNAAA